MTAPIRVLVVDDALDYAEMVVQFLRASGEWTGRVHGHRGDLRQRHHRADDGAL